MKWRRFRRGQVETAWASDRYDAKDKIHALAVLGDAVVLVRHPYERSPHSGAGNCWCGREANSRLHSVVLEPAGQTKEGE